MHARWVSEMPLQIWQHCLTRVIAQRRSRVVIKINNQLLFLFLFLLSILLPLFAGGAQIMASRVVSFPKFVTRRDRFVFPFWHDLELFFFIIYERIGRHTLDKKDVAADRRSCADDGFAAQNR
jgi:hypothetical protein